MEQLVLVLEVSGHRQPPFVCVDVLVERQESAGHGFVF